MSGGFNGLNELAKNIQKDRNVCQSLAMPSFVQIDRFILARLKPL